MEFKNGTLGRAVLTAAIVAAAATATMACSKEPQLNVQNAPQETPASAPAAPADADDPGRPGR